MAAKIIVLKLGFYQLFEKWRESNVAKKDSKNLGGWNFIISFWRGCIGDMTGQSELNYFFRIVLGLSQFLPTKGES